MNKYIFLSLLLSFAFISCEEYDLETDGKPGITTDTVSSFTVNTALMGGNVTAENGNPITAKGVCWSTSENPTVANSKTTDGSGTGPFASTLTGLNGNTTYYARAYATNSAGTIYGNQVSFTTYAVMDIDGNGYRSVIIGTQEWLVENLKTTKYRNGDAIPEVSYSGQWSALTTGAYCNYNNDNSKSKDFGKLYNWYAVYDIRQIAPEGWHVPTNDEWDILRDYVGSAQILRNEYGFKTPFGGYRSSSGSFEKMEDMAYWWTYTESSSDYAYYWYLYDYYNSFYSSYGNKKYGYSVRCIKGAAPPIARVVNIGTGTATQRAPHGCYYGYERSAAIYTSAEIGMSGAVSELAWYSTIRTYTDVPVKIYIKHTSASTLTASTWSTMISGATLVFNGTIVDTYAGSWLEFTLSPTFSYNMSNNLLVLVEANYGGDGTEEGALYRYTSSSSRHMYYYSDDNPPTGNGTVDNQRPNIKITIMN